ncbi:MAG: phosphatidate cytidylyltransferase [Clostridiales bacterium]|nr:phosphatidate cytidylyltransferase [Clostridiales bacterium]
MATRIIVAAIAIPLLLLLIFLAPLWAFAILAGTISAGAALELLGCVDSTMPRRFRVYAAISGFLTSLFWGFEKTQAFSSLPMYLLCLIMFAELMLSFRKQEQISFETLLQVLFAGAVMPLLLSWLVRIGQRENFSVYLLLPFVAAFSSDSGGYFAGMYLGKRKVFPHLSPNKTLAGCLGGFGGAVLMMLLYGFVLSFFNFEINYIYLIIYGLLGSLACQLGDLAFSAIKRQYGIKDYGKLIPGHGGMLDRFDSMHFTAPMIGTLALLLPAIA